MKLHRLDFAVRVQVGPGHPSASFRMPVKRHDRAAGVVEDVVDPANCDGLPPSPALYGTSDGVLLGEHQPDRLRAETAAEHHGASLKGGTVPISRSAAARDNAVIGHQPQNVAQRLNQQESRFARSSTRQTDANSRGSSARGVADRLSR